MSIEKAQCRRKFRHLLEDLSPNQAQDRSTEIVEGIAEWLNGLKGLRRIAMFSALPGEPQLVALHDDRPGRELLYPLVRDRSSMSFHRVESPSTLVVGCYGVREPDPAIHPLVPLDEIDMFLCPGLGFGLDGTRLGRGGGYYDRALASARTDAPRIGTCFRDQIVPSLPREEHDAMMTHLAEESGILELAGISPRAEPPG